MLDNQSVASLLFGCLACLAVTSVVNADGRMFVLDLRNSSGLQGYRDAERACAARHARLASAQELHHAVMECFFSPCTRGWLYGGTVGTTVCNVVGSAMKAVDVKTENATEGVSQLDAFCIKDKGVPCGDPPSFPNARLQGHSGYEMGDELLYTCVPGYVMPSGHSAFSLLCDSCGEWYGLVEICVKDATESHVDYEDKFTDAYGEAERLNEKPEEAHGEVYEEVHEAVYPEDKMSQEQQETSFSVEVDEKHQYENGQHDVRGEVIGRKSEGAETNEERAVDGFIGHPRWEQERKEVTTDAAAATEAPVSILSQKHLFWFPAEAFQEEGPPVSINPSTQTTQRASGAQSEESKENESQERHHHQRPVDVDDHDDDDHEPEGYNDHDTDDQDDRDDDLDGHDDSHHDDQEDRDSHQEEDDHDDHVKHYIPASDDLDGQDHLKNHDDHDDHYDMGEHEEEDRDRDHVRFGSQEYDDREETYDEHESYEDHEDVIDDHDDDHRKHPDGSEEHPDRDDHDSEEHYDLEDDDNDHYTDHEDHEHDDRDSYDDHDSHEDVDGGHQHVIVSIATDKDQNVTQEAAGGKATTDETWLDGYPVIPEETENGDSTTKKVRLEDRERGIVVRTTDKPNEVEIRQPLPHTSSPEVPESPTSEPALEEGGVKGIRPHLIPSAAPSPDPSDSPSYSDTLDYDTQQVAPTHSWLGDLTEDPFHNHDPAPPVLDGNVLTGVTEEHTVHSLPGETGERGEMEGDMGEAMCTGGDCPPHPPSSSSRGPTVAAIIVVVCALATAVIIGVWCYRRQQQKSSMYEMNGKGQSQIRQGQQIEMQQKV